MPRFRVAILLIGLMTLAPMAAHGSDDNGAQGAPDTGATAPFARCRDVEPIRANAELYRDQPVYVANEQPSDEVRRWARSRPGYAGIWIDRERFGWLNVLFTEDVARRQAQLERRFPGVGVVAVEVPFSEQELRELQERAITALEELTDSFSIGLDVRSGLVDIGLPVLDVDIVQRLTERFAGAPLCIDGRDPSEAVAPGPQPTGGDGWTLLGHREGRGPNYRTGIATDASSLEAMSDTAGISIVATDIDFERQVVVWFAIGHGSSCPNLRLDDVVVDLERAVLHPQVVDPDRNMACTDDLAGSYQFIVGLDRERLPAGPFVIGLDPDTGRAGGRPTTAVDVDLTQAGSVANVDDVHPARPKGGKGTLRSGDITEALGSATYVLDASCGIAYLGVLNNTHWVTEAEDDNDAWTALMDEDEELVLTVRLRTTPTPHIKATAGGETMEYRPVASAPPSCPS